MGKQQIGNDDFKIHKKFRQHWLPTWAFTPDSQCHKLPCPLLPSLPHLPPPPFPFQFSLTFYSSALKHPCKEAGTCTFTFPCILGTSTLLEGISQSEFSNDQVSVFLHWHHQKWLIHTCAIYSPDVSCLFLTAHDLSDYLHQTHLGWSFCASRTSSPSSTACKVPRWGVCIRPPRGRRTKGQACTRAFRVFLRLPQNACMKSGGKSSMGRYSRAEIDEVSSVSKLFPARFRSLRGFRTLILNLLLKESCENLQERRHHSQVSMNTPSSVSPLFRGTISEWKSLLW